MERLAVAGVGCAGAGADGAAAAGADGTAGAAAGVAGTAGAGAEGAAAARGGGMRGACDGTTGVEVVGRIAGIPIGAGRTPAGMGRPAGGVEPSAAGPAPEGRRTGGTISGGRACVGRGGVGVTGGAEAAAGGGVDGSSGVKGAEPVGEAGGTGDRGAPPLGRIAAPGIGGVSLGNDGRGAGVPAGARDPMTNAVAGVARIGGLSGGAEGGGGVIGRTGGGVIGRTGGGVIGRTGGGVTGRAGSGVTSRTGGGVTGRAGGGVTARGAGTGDVYRGVRWSAGTGIGSGAASASDSSMARSASFQVSTAADPRTAGSSATWITAPQTEQRARIPAGGTLAGSTRKIDWHSVHETFNAPPTRWRARLVESACHPRARPHDDRPRRPTPAGSWRSSSSRSPAR